MNQAEYLGAQLVMLIRRQAGELAAWQRTTAKINDLYDQIEAMSGTEVYASTGEIPRVGTGQPRERVPLPGDAVTETLPSFYREEITADPHGPHPHGGARCLDCPECMGADETVVTPVVRMDDGSYRLQGGRVGPGN